ncbi:periplasmic nitrate reductase, NapE protein [Rhodospirillum centenum]|uniref:Periplasmic reductase, NapE n=1 Tax=Rhodospirillum centenum (strain ATCC 51521 / SW) TaxID=414684 RepID=B6IR07_RHOCS|nr:periplasmic nitrate reductase, NapE protein [Rhodospirillum centenum]ACI97893.1 periplasmic reductase, NapE [Rhodospirillum centenum SW]
MSQAPAPPAPDSADPVGDAHDRRRVELVAFFFLAFVIWPFLAVAVVGGYGFLVWMYQLVMGPPGPSQV